jgi:hypothetical protein
MIMQVRNPRKGLARRVASYENLVRIEDMHSICILLHALVLPFLLVVVWWWRTRRSGRIKEGNCR